MKDLSCNVFSRAVSLNVGKAVSIQLLGGADTAGYVRENRPSPLLCHKGCITLRSEL